MVVVPLNLDCTKESRQCVVGDQNNVNFCVTLVCNECDIDEDTVSKVLWHIRCKDVSRSLVELSGSTAPLSLSRLEFLKTETYILILNPRRFIIFNLNHITFCKYCNINYLGVHLE